MTAREGLWRAALHDALHDALFVLDGTGALVHMNDEFGALLGYGPEGLPYHRPFPWWPDPATDPYDSVAVRETNRRVAEGAPGQWLVRLRHRDGHRLWVECSTAAIGEGADRQVVGIARDVTAAQRAVARDRLLAETGGLLIHSGELAGRLNALAAAIADHYNGLVMLERTGPDGSMEPVVTAHAGAGPPQAGSPDPADPRTLVTPLVLAQGVVGRLSVVGPPGSDPFDESDLRLAEEMAVRIAGVLQADRLATRERQLHDASAALAVAATAQEAAAALAAVLKDALGPSGVVVYTVAPDDPGRMRLTHNLGFPSEFEAGFTSIRLDRHRLVSDLLRTGRPFWFPDRDSWVRRYPYLGAISSLGDARAGIVAPMRLGDRIVGVMVAAFAGDRDFSADERSFVLTLAGQAGQAVERAELTDAQGRIARRLQQSLMSRHLPSVDGYSMATHYQPAGELIQAGGDWCQIFELGGDRLAIVVGDVVGHGLAASMVMARLRIGLAAYLVEGHGPAESLRLLSQAACRIEGALASTTLCMVLDVRTGDLRWASAGHPPPLLLDPSDEREPVRYLSGARGGVLGAGHAGGFSVAHTEARLTLAPGASVLLYSDGLVERRQENLGEGLNRLSRAVAERLGAGSDELLEAMLSGALEGTTPDDDVAVVVVQRDPVPAQALVSEPVVVPATSEPVRPDAAAIFPAAEVTTLDDIAAHWDHDGALTLELVGALDLSTVEIVGPKVMRHLGASTGRVTIDIAGVDYLGSAGIRLLAEALQQSQDRIRLRVERGSAAATSLSISGFELDAVDLWDR